MDLYEAKHFVDAFIEAGRTREKTVELISSLPLNGDSSKVFEYVDIKYSEAPAQVDTWNFTDAENAEYFTTMYADKLRFDHRRNRWLEWNDHFWRTDNDGQVTRLALKAVRSRYHGTAEITDLEKREKLAIKAITSEQRARLSSMVAIAQDLKPIADSGENWDKNPWLIATANQVINLRSGLPLDGNQNDMITMITRVKYERNARADRWNRFLNEIFEDNQELLKWIKKYLGYCITGFTNEQVIPIGHGNGANGKTVLLNIIERILGDYAYNAPFTMFELTNRSSIPNDLAALDGKRFVTARETTEGSRFNEGRIKALTGGDPITARFLHGEFFTFKPFAKYFLAVNSRPRVHDESYGFWRRVRLIPFNRRFEGIDDDKNLTETLLSESPGIFNYLIEGCLLWQKEGLDPTPEFIETATREYESDSDPLSEFILDECAFSSQAQVSASKFYKAYKSWCQSQGYQDREIMTNTIFGKKMGKKFKKSHQRTGTIYTGVGLKCDGFVTGFEPVEQKCDVFPHMNPFAGDKVENPSQLITTFENSSQQDNQLADCPSCGKNEWTYSPDGLLLCPCGRTFKDGEL